MSKQSLCVAHELLYYVSITVIYNVFLSTVTADLKLLPSAGSDRAWVWNPQADYADEEAKPEQLAIRFANAESEYMLIYT